MPRPDPALFDAGRYPHHCEVQTRYGDLDPNGHINNITMAGMIQNARMLFHADSHFQAMGPGMGVIVARFAIDYLASAHFPAPLMVSSALTRLGRTSFTMAQLAVQDDIPVAWAETTIVWVPDQHPAPLPDLFIAHSAEWMLHP